MDTAAIVHSLPFSLSANNTKLQLTFALYFLYTSETNVLKLWFYSYLYPEGHRLSLLPSQLKVQPKGFSCIWAKPNNTIQLHWIHSLFSCLTPHQFWNIYFPTPPPPMHKTTMVTINNIYMLGALVSICQSSSVSLFCLTVIPMERNLSSEKI